MQEVISVKNLTKEYKNGHGIFDVNLSIRKGEVFGYLGPNGAGKTTTIRHLLGFIKPDSGKTTITYFKKNSANEIKNLAKEFNVTDLTKENMLEAFNSTIQDVKDSQERKKIIKKYKKIISYLDGESAEKLMQTWKVEHSTAHGVSLKYKELKNEAKSKNDKNRLQKLKKEFKLIKRNLFVFDTWKDSSKVMEKLGYLPGEIAMPENMTGIEFIRYIFNLRKLSDWSVVEDYIKYWEFDPNVRIKRMSKGMKQKVGLILTFMHDPEVLILDEPTSGLDPLMQEKFIALIKKAKSEGKTIIMSSHIFPEIEKTCDRVAVIKSGRIISLVDMNDIIFNKIKTYDIQFKNKEDMNKIADNKFEIIKTNDKWNSVVYRVDQNNVDLFVKQIAKYNISYMREVPYTLEDYFMKFYGSDDEKRVN